MKVLGTFCGVVLALTASACSGVGSTDSGEGSEPMASEKTEAAEVTWEYNPEAPTPVYEQEVREGVTVSYWATTEDGPAAIALTGPLGDPALQEKAALDLRRPTEVFAALSPDLAVPQKLLDLEERYRDAWNMPPEVANSHEETVSAPQRSLKTHGESWWIDKCNSKGTNLECLSAAGNAAGTATLIGGNHTTGPGCPDPLWFAAYNDHTGSSTYAVEWVSGTLFGKVLTGNTWANVNITSNGNAISNLLANIDSGSVGRVLATCP